MRLPKLLNMRKTHFVTAVFFLFVISSCTSPDKGIDPAFNQYVDLFIEEAAKRDVTFNYTDVRGIQFDDLDASIGGTCNFVTSDITIRQDGWDNATDDYRTRVIFHELGHCFLDRRHLNSEFTGGHCLSLMAGEDLACSNTYSIGSIWYDYYNDELFDENTPIPDWYITEFDKPILETLIDTTATSTTLGLNLIGIDLSQNFEIRATFINWQNNDNLELSLGTQKLVISNNIIFLTSSYLLQDPILSETTTIRFVQYEGLDYFFVDDKIFHIDNFDLDFFNISISTKKSIGQAEDIGMELQLNLLEN